MTKMKNRKSTSKTHENHRTYLKNVSSFHPHEERGRPAEVAPHVPGAFGKGSPDRVPKAARNTRMPDEKADGRSTKDMKKETSLFGRVTGWLKKWVPSTAA